MSLVTLPRFFRFVLADLARACLTFSQAWLSEVGPFNLGLGQVPSTGSTGAGVCLFRGFVGGLIVGY